MEYPRWSDMPPQYPIRPRQQKFLRLNTARLPPRRGTGALRLRILVTNDRSAKGPCCNPLIHWQVVGKLYKGLENNYLQSEGAGSKQSILPLAASGAVASSMPAALRSAGRKAVGISFLPPSAGFSASGDRLLRMRYWITKTRRVLETRSRSGVL